MAPTAVSVASVVKRVRDGRERRTVLDEVSFDIAAGELVILRGRSGSGKTTLLGVVGAMLCPTSGEVYLQGQPTSRMREHHRAEVRRRGVGFVFQDLQLIDAMTVAENVLLPRVPEGVSTEDRRRAKVLLDRFGVGDLAGTRARGLSAGERQRVALARAVLHDPPLVLMDEPTAHLDDARAAEVTALLTELAREGRALLVATHDPRVVSAAGITRILELSGGHIARGR